VTGLAIKIALAIFAFVAAVLGVSDLKTVARDDSTFPLPWWRRITGVGYIKITFAALTLLLIGVNEYWSYQSGIRAKAEADRQTADIQAKLNQAHEDLLTDASVIERLSRTNDYLVIALDNSLVRAGVARVTSDQIDNQLVALQFENAQPVVLKRDDIVEWSLSCDAGRLPPILETSTCSQAGYGRLVANGFSVVLDEKSSRRTYFGTNSTSDALTFRSTAEGSACPATSEALKQALCKLEINVMREARWKFEDLKMTHAALTQSSISNDAQDACRRYRALFGESCEDALRK
jgi:hypothetical protein